MKKENKSLGLDIDHGEISGLSSTNNIDSGGENDDIAERAESNEVEEMDSKTKSMKITKEDAVTETSDLESSPESSIDSDYASRETVEKRLTEDTVPDATIDELEENAEDGAGKDSEDLPAPNTNVDGKVKPKIGKAKEKRAKRAAKMTTTTESSEAGAEFRCATCQAGFPSKTRLFNHIKDLGHAQPPSSVSKASKGKKK
jgi:DnaJ family protein A protein 5